MVPSPPIIIVDHFDLSLTCNPKPPLSGPSMVPFGSSKQSLLIAALATTSSWCFVFLRNGANADYPFKLYTEVEIGDIDELVMQALKVKSIRKKGSKDIESFTHVLSEIQYSLKPWAPRFQKALSSHSIGSENQLGQSLVSRTVPSKNEDKNNIVHSPTQTKLESLVSPSPLVSWRADCTIEGGRQLFLLTPLPRPKAFSSKLQGSSRPAIGKIPSLVAISRDAKDELLEGAVMKPSPSKVSDSFVAKKESTIDFQFVSPPKLSKKDCSVLVMTPCLKMSPPKSCVLLEPISEVSHKDHHGVRKSTPFPVGIQDFSGSETSESSSGEVSDNLALKYPELFGIQPPQKLGIGRKNNGVEASPNWFMSPPKTCVLMEPSDEKSLAEATINCQLPRTACVQNQPTYFSSVNRQGVRTNHCLTRFYSQEPECSSKQIESTPVWKEPGSTFQTGKHPGENTLKKELWTKFEAASTHGIRFSVSVLEETAQKGFLDRLDEVFYDETSPNS
ncbi:hypothetical protein U1Q18_026926 [Sarracenia purpurea var. burkii]